MRARPDAIVDPMPSRHIVISGCSGGGKSTLLACLTARGFDTVSEPGRRIVDEELAGTGSALPWVNLAAFAKRAIEVADLDRRLASEDRWTFFDRGLVDAASALEFASGEPLHDTLGSYARYHRLVFLTPPWPEIYVNDQQRPHDLADAIAEYERLVEAYDRLGYEAIVIPKVAVEERADFIVSHLE